MGKLNQSSKKIMAKSARQAAEDARYNADVSRRIPLARKLSASINKRLQKKAEGIRDIIIPSNKKVKRK